MQWVYISEFEHIRSIVLGLKTIGLMLGSLYFEVYKVQMKLGFKLLYDTCAGFLVLSHVNLFIIFADLGRLCLTHKNGVELLLKFGLIMPLVNVCDEIIIGFRPIIIFRFAIILMMDILLISLWAVIPFVHLGVNIM